MNLENDLELALPESVNVRVDSIEFDRSEDGIVQRLIYHFRLGIGDAWTLLPVSMTEISSSMDENWKSAHVSLYTMLAALTERARLDGGYPALTYKDSSKSIG
jgi:hypothetical protein